MIINEFTAISTPSILLVPYTPQHVPTYHAWMQDMVILTISTPQLLITNTPQDLQALTASEPLSLAAEYAMQTSWRSDRDKLTFIACKPMPPGSISATLVAGEHDGPSNMVGDVNLFLSVADEDAAGVIGELELMIAPVEERRKGFGKASMSAFLEYVDRNLERILAEFGGEGGVKLRLLQLKVKIGSKNSSSIGLFEGLGFLRVGEGENYFGEVELVLEGFLGERKGGRRVEGYKELNYVRDGEKRWESK